MTEIVCPYCHKPIKVSVTIGSSVLPGYGPLSFDALKNCSVREALVMIARSNSGRLTTEEAAAILVEANVCSDKSQAHRAVSSALHYAKTKGWFRRQGRGCYLLIGRGGVK